MSSAVMTDGIEVSIRIWVRFVMGYVNKSGLEGADTPSP